MFTPVETTIGALLLLQSTTTLLLTTGQPLGASSTLGTTLTSPSLHNLPLITGMLLATTATSHLAPHLLPPSSPAVSNPRYILAALLVGAGTRLANGCTSGHLLCGVPHLSIRSIVASGVFFTTAAITATLSSVWYNTTPGCPGGLPCYTPSYPTSAETSTLLAILAATTLVSAGTFLLPRGRASHALVRGWVGVTFALGLLISGMADATKPLRFLTFRRELWDPSLIMVVVGAVVPSMVGWGWGVRRVGKPVVGGEWMVRGKEVGARLVGGSVLFGLGWGMAGVCPGPGVVGLAVGMGGVAVGWVAAFWVGWGVAGWF
ncbi:uncharacterized protein H6S33_004884 [Morchella sextelata]|uniref:uncharacterized protein n=1 Tax=Morchella sextelata TaxID=1174677 RepID=UPI001D056E28|nr:uncharacterized protein H6S33_004884 [Morchella sextelata]KAH0605662.1 hypothetical protein H6S33_004884 [Morchella sextelata]